MGALQRPFAVDLPNAAAAKFELDDADTGALSTDLRNWPVTQFALSSFAGGTINTWNTDSGVRSMGLEVLRSSDVAADVGIVEGAEVGLVG